MNLTDPAVSFPGLTTTTTTANGFWYNGTWRPVFAGGDGTDGDSGDGGGAETASSDEDGDSKTPPGDGDSGTEEKTFTQEEVNAILAREKSKATRGKVSPKDYGFDSQKDFDAWVKAQKDKQDKDKTEEEKKLADAIAAAEKQAEDKIMSKANARLIKSEFKVAARDAGIPKEALEDAYLLAQTLEDWDVEVDDEKDVVVGLSADFFKELKKQKPFLFPESKTGSGDAGAGAGGGGRSKDAGSVQEIYPALRNVQ